MKIPKITFLVDYPNWAFDFVAKSIKRRLSYKYNFEIKYVSRKDKLDPKSTDLLYVFFWGESYYESFNFHKSQIIKEVASLRWENEEKYGMINVNEFVYKYLSDCTCVTTPAISLLNKLESNVDNIFHCPNGVELNLYHNYGHKKMSDKLKIGWVGNPDDLSKGLRDILMPASSGFDFRFTDGKLSRYQLVKFYNDIDVLAISSVAESQPLPLLESMASGCFPVATNVGIVPELIVSGDNGLVVERSIESFRSAFNWCSENLTYVRNIAKLNRSRASCRSWDLCVTRFSDVFDYALNKKNNINCKIDKISNIVNCYDSEIKENTNYNVNSDHLLFKNYIRAIDYITKIVYGDRYNSGILSTLNKK